jgi:hypothetical protein
MTMARSRVKFKMIRKSKFHVAFVDDEGLYIDDEEFDDIGQCNAHCSNKNRQEKARTGAEPWITIRRIVSITHVN